VEARHRGGGAQDTIEWVGETPTLPGQPPHVPAQCAGVCWTNGTRDSWPPDLDLGRFPHKALDKRVDALLHSR
jgi:hypothetical protein